MYTLEKFGTLTLPTARPALTVGAPPVQSAITAVAAGGGYDGLGTAQARGKPFTIVHNCALYSTSSQTAIQTQLDAIKAVVGTRSRLYRRMPDGSLNWITARLVSLDATRTIDNQNYLDISLTFQASEYPWHGLRHGDGWVLDAGEYFDTGLAFDESGLTVPMPTSGTVSVTNGGNATVRNAIITVTAAGTNITEITLTKSGETDLKYVGTIVAGQSLVINCGAYSVKNNGVDDYANFSRETNHVIAEWLNLAPGVNTIGTTRTGGNASSSITFTFDDGAN